jgi:hypothetical protein
LVALITSPLISTYYGSTYSGDPWDGMMILTAKFSELTSYQNEPREPSLLEEDFEKDDKVIFHYQIRERETEPHCRLYEKSTIGSGKVSI